MFGSEAFRLLRKKWKQANELAQELFAILSNDDLPLEHKGPITLDPPAGGGPALIFRNFGDGTPAIQIQRADGGPNITLYGDGLNMDGAPIINKGAGPIDLGTTNLDGSLPQGVYGDIPPLVLNNPLAMPGYVAPGFDLPTARNGGLKPGQGASQGKPEPKQRGTGGVAGQVTAGSGDTYTVDLYDGGRSAGANSVSVTILQIDSGETLPAGTWLVVFQDDDGYFAQPPVWLG